MSTGPVPKRRRTGKPKAKTGCLTCKIRRVKCDEARPECLRCQKFGIGFCDGYQPDPIHPNQTSNKVIHSNSRPLAPYPAQPTLQKFQNDDELRSFRLYCDEVAPGLSFSTSIWKHLLLQAGQDQQFIQHGIIAIGGLYKSLQIMGTNTIRVPGTHKLPPSLSGEQPPRHSTHARVHEFALQHYGVFLRGVKEHMALAKPERGLRTALIACLLVYCVENMQLHHREAIMHAQNGLRLMAEFLNKKSKPRDPLNSSSSAPRNVFLEDEIVQQFQRLDLQILAVSDLRTTNDHLKTDGPIDVKTMPPTFKTIEDAKTYLELITRRSFYFVAQAFTTSRFLTYLEPTEEVLTASSPGSTANYSRSIKGLTTTDQSPGNGHSISNEIPSSCLSRLIISTPPSTQVQQEIYASENRRWQHAFETLFQSAIRELSQPESLQALLLMVQSTSLTVRLAGHLSPTELIYDQFLPEFEKIVRWSRMILDHPCSDTFFSPGSFILDMGLIYHVLTVAMYCRDRNLKRQAIAILKQKPWREAQWGSDSAADVATFIMEIEEEGVETEYIPESARARMCGVEVNASARTVRLHCLQGPRESVIHRESERDWSMTGG